MPIRPISYILVRSIKSYGVKLGKLELASLLYIILAIVYPLAVVLLGRLLASIAGFHVDWFLSGFVSSIMAVSKETGISIQILMIIAVIQLLFAPFINAIFALGEEIGWIGYLLDRLNEEHGVLPAVLISGVYGAFGTGQ